MTTPEQDKIIEALAVEHGAVKVLPLRGTDAVLACGWSAGSDGLPEPRGPWWYVEADPARTTASGKACLRYAYDYEIKNAEREDADALEQDAVRELLSAAGLR